MRFVTVGAVNTGVDVALFTVLYSVGLGVGLANLLSTSAGMATSFVLNRRFTFRATGGNLYRQLLTFTGVNLVGLWLLQPLVISAVARVLPVPAAKVGATAVTMVWMFGWYRWVVFAPSRRTVAAR